MGRANSVQASWTKGEVSPLAAGRVDVSLYAAGAEVIENLIVRPQGPLFRRSGTKYVNSTKVPTNESVLVPFEVSDEQAYMLEFGKGYIRFYKNKEPIFDSATSKFTNITAYSNGGLMQLGAESVNSNPTTVGQVFGDMPTFDIQSIAPYFVVSDKYQITTTVPHGFKTGTNVFILGAAAGATNVSGSVATILAETPVKITLTSSDTIFPTTGTIVLYNSTNHPDMNGIWGITRVSANTYTIDGTTSGMVTAGACDIKWGKQFSITSTSPKSFTISVNSILAAAATTGGFVATNGLIAGDKFSVGTSDYTQMSSRYMIAKSVENANRWTTANLNGSAGSPTGLAYTIPIEIATGYGYGRPVTVTSTFSSGGYVGVTTAYPHGLANNDSVVLDGCGAGVDGVWTVVYLTTTTFRLAGSGYNAVTSGGTARKVLTASEFSFKDLKFAQSADVLYITHPLYPPTKLVRLDDDGDRNDWLLADASFRDGPYMGLNDLSPNINSTTPQDGAIYPDVYMEVSSYAHTATVKSVTTFTGQTITATSAGAGTKYKITIAGHGYVTGDYILIEGCGGNAAGANGNWIVTRIDANNFDLDGSTYAAGGTLGTAIPAYFEYKEGNQWRLGYLTTAHGLTSASAVIIDNVMLAIDETTLLNDKTKVASTTASGAVYKKQGARGGLGLGSAAGYYSRTGQYLGKIDPGNELSSFAGLVSARVAASTVTSHYSNTFSLADVGKYVRIKGKERTEAGYWVKILSIGAGAGSADSTANKAQHGRSLAMVSNNETGRFVVSVHTRTCTLTSKKQGNAFVAFASTDVGRSVRLGFAGQWTWGKITGYTSTSVVTVTLYEDMPRDPNDASRIAGNQEGMKTDGTLTTALTTTGITYDWRMGAWSYTTGFPACVVFHEQRLTFGATSTEPQTFWMSTSGDFENMSPTELDSTVLDDSAIAYELASAKANPIRWLISGSALGVGTAGGEWQVKSASSINDPITPSSISAKEYTTHGAGSRIQPAKIGSSVLFVDRSKHKVHELFYSYQDDAVVSDELTVISEHILREHSGAVAAAFQQKPHSIYWIVCGDGTLSAVTFNKKQEVTAWHHHTIAGATVEWISTIPSNDGTEDEVWMVCKRTVNEAEYRTIEVLESDFYPASASSRSGMKFQDGHITIPSQDPYFTGTVITGLNWLIGQAVTVTADGTRLTGTYTVNPSGEITLAANTYDVIFIGVNGNADVGSLPPEGGSPFGNSQGQQKRLVSLDVRFLDTMNVSFGPSSSSLVSKTLTPASGIWFSKTERLIPNNGWDVESKYYIRQSEPYPLNILMVVAKLETNE